MFSRSHGMAFSLEWFSWCGGARSGDPPSANPRTRGASARLAAEQPIDLVSDDEIVAIETEPTACVHHLVRGRCERRGAAELSRQLEHEQHVLLLQRDVGERHLRH